MEDIQASVAFYCLAKPAKFFEAPTQAPKQRMLPTIKDFGVFARDDECQVYIQALQRRKELEKEKRQAESRRQAAIKDGRSLQMALAYKSYEAALKSLEATKVPPPPEIFYFLVSKPQTELPPFSAGATVPPEWNVHLHNSPVELEQAYFRAAKNIFLGTDTAMMHALNTELRLDVACPSAVSPLDSRCFTLMGPPVPLLPQKHRHEILKRLCASLLLHAGTSESSLLNALNSFTTRQLKQADDRRRATMAW